MGAWCGEMSLVVNGVQRKASTNLPTRGPQNTTPVGKRKGVMSEEKDKRGKLDSSCDEAKQKHGSEGASPVPSVKGTQGNAFTSLESISNQRG